MNIQNKYQEIGITEQLMLAADENGVISEKSIKNKGFYNWIRRNKGNLTVSQFIEQFEFSPGQNFQVVDQIIEKKR